MKCYPVSESNALKFSKYAHRTFDISPKPFLFGIRNESHLNSFNDIVGVHFWRDCKPHVLVTTGTTDPGLPWVVKPWTPLGSVILAVGFHKNIWELGNRSKLGPHRNILVFRQNGSSCLIYRDKNRDGKVQRYEPKQRGNFEIQFHPMVGKKGKSARVGRWSAGCQGPNDIEAWNQIVAIAEGHDLLTDKTNRVSYLLMGKIGDSSNYPQEFLKPLEGLK